MPHICSSHALIPATIDDRFDPRGRRHFRLLRRCARAACGALLAGAVLSGGAPPAAAQTSVLTHHNDIGRTGWNATETVLTANNVVAPGPAGAFGLLATVKLDGYVDAQPLVVPGVLVAGDPHPGTHDVVYVATQANTIYAIDPTTATVLRSRNFGTPPSRIRGCIGTPDAVKADLGVGISGTPVIDLHQQLLYVVVFTLDALPGGRTAETYRLHALDLATLHDRIPPVVIAGSHALTDGTTLAFDPKQQRQRPALLEFRNGIYTAFGSFCDNALARGWVFGWLAPTLKPVDPGGDGTPVGNLTDQQPLHLGGLFLSSIWMSGAGPAADGHGIYYVTGNSDISGTRYDPVHNPEQSVVRLSFDTTTVLDRFTPSNLQDLDKRDNDFGAGGVMLLPRAATGLPPLAVAAGKIGTMFLLNRVDLGGFTPGGPNKVLDAVSIGNCWCTPSYFDDGTPTVVSSGGFAVELWTVQTAPKPALVPRASRALPQWGQDPGFFTSVSSNGAKDVIIWAVSRPLSADEPTVSLYAFSLPAPGKSTTLPQIFSAPAGTWPDVNHDSNIVPVVANGRVYVASDAALAIFGLGARAPAAIGQ